MVPIFLPLLCYSAIILPNILMITSNSQAASFNAVDYFNTYYNFQHHAFLEDHFRLGYTYTLLLIVSLWTFYKIGLSSDSQEETEMVFMIIAIALLGSAVWLLNLYTLKQLQVIYLYFITRAFCFVKPLLILLCVLSYHNISLTLNKSWSNNLITASILVTILVLSPTLALILVASHLLFMINCRTGLLFLFISLCCYAALIYLTAYTSLPAFLLLCLRLNIESPYHWSLYLFEIIIFSIGLTTAAGILKQPNIINLDPEIASPPPFLRPLPSTTLALWATIFFVPFLSAHNYRKYGPINFSAKEYFGIRSTKPAYADLVDHATKFPGGLFVVPPYSSVFGSFRFLTKKGIYIHLSDINQLSYSPDYYSEAYRRMLKLGLKIKKRRHYNWTSFDQMSLLDFQKTGADYVIIENNEYRTSISSAQPVFSNNKYSIYQLHAGIQEE